MALLVGALDFGTTYSGWAFSFTAEYEKDPTKAHVKNWQSGSGTLTTEKTPTCLLVKPDGITFHAYGYDAENIYRDLLDRNQHNEYFYFRRFKMLLFNASGKKLSKMSKAKDETGKELLAIDVFAMSIKYLADDMMYTVRNRITQDIKDTEVNWVLTVPAIWSDTAKQFMREAAIKAGISNERLTISLEPEAASLYCRHLSVDKTNNPSDVVLSKLPAGSKYIILDAGGGTIDITVHEVQSEHTLREVRAASGGDWGGTMVDMAFENFLIELFGKAVIEKIKMTETEDWLYLTREFETKKREAGIDRKRRIVICFPVSIIDIYEQEHEKQNSIKDAIAASRYAETVELKRDKLKISQCTVENLFKESINKTVHHTKTVMNDEQMVDVRAILMVGGYSEAPLLQEAIRVAFPGIQVIISFEASSAVLRGALIFGHNPSSITERVLKYTYGVSCNMKFQEGKHPERRRIKTDRGDRCKDIFNKFVEIGQSVKLGETLIKDQYVTVHKNQPDMLIDIYISTEKTPDYVDDKSCERIGTIKIVFDEPEENPGRHVYVSMLFGGTEVIVELEDEKTERKSRVETYFWG